MRRVLCFALVVTVLCGWCCARQSSEAAKRIEAGQFRWEVGGSVVEPVQRAGKPPAGELIYSVKDPSIVRYKGRWHLFCTIRGRPRSHRIEYLCFEDWDKVGEGRREILKLSDGYFCAPQVFYFRPHRKWYMILQVIDESRKPALQPAFSTTNDINKPGSWSKPVLLFKNQPADVRMWIDFWVICDETEAHLFFTSLDGKMWQADTKKSNFPFGWARPEVALEGDIFEASHTYKLKGTDKYLTVVEAQDKQRSRRYYKAYLAERLAGRWEAIAATKDKPFAGPVNVKDAAGHWTDSFSHGELLRAGYDERLEVEPEHLRFLFQGVTDEQKQGKVYGQIPWRLGLLKAVRE